MTRSNIVAPKNHSDCLNISALLLLHPSQFPYPECLGVVVVALLGLLHVLEHHVLEAALQLVEPRALELQVLLVLLMEVVVQGKKKAGKGETRRRRGRRSIRIIRRSGKV